VYIRTVHRQQYLYEDTVFGSDLVHNSSTSMAIRPGLTTAVFVWASQSLRYEWGMSNPSR
jgi:hypothetical protein